MVITTCRPSESEGRQGHAFNREAPALRPAVLPGLSLTLTLACGLSEYPRPGASIPGHEPAPEAGAGGSAGGAGGSSMPAPTTGGRGGSGNGGKRQRADRAAADGGSGGHAGGTGGSGGSGGAGAGAGGTRQAPARAGRAGRAGPERGPADAADHAPFRRAGLDQRHAGPEGEGHRLPAHRPLEHGRPGDHAGRSAPVQLRDPSAPVGLRQGRRLEAGQGTAVRRQHERQLRRRRLRRTGGRRRPGNVDPAHRPGGGAGQPTWSRSGGASRA